ncbi:hypothetical protein AB0P36_35635 [Streptomyces flavidovirens]|uniref:hypothetical protein n=1 Tax=Streptomyces flavidovirens TaxID=67298 RepID=UPI00342DE31B
MRARLAVIAALAVAAVALGTTPAAADPEFDPRAVLAPIDDSNNGLITFEAPLIDIL